MSQTQSLFIIGGMLLLSTLVLSRGTHSISHIERTLHIEAVTDAFSIGQSAIEQINSVAFDEKTIAKDIKITTDLSLTLGKDAGEFSLNQFDDVDDFNNFTWSDSTKKLGRFNAKINVSYGTTANPEVKTTSRTFHKIVEILITNEYLLQDTLKLKTIIGY